jgi:hypothetical protein
VNEQITGRIFGVQLLAGAEYFLRRYQLSSKEERPKRDADISSPFSAESKTALSFTSLCTAYGILLMHRDNLIFPDDNISV